MNADGSGPTQLTLNTLPDGTMTWSPDGTKIVWGRAVPPPNQQLHIMNPDGSGQIQITFPPGIISSRARARSRRALDPEPGRERFAAQNVKRMPNWPVRGTAPARSAV